MSVLVRGMEMPTGCDDCEFCERAINGYDWCCIPMVNGRSKPLDEPVIKPDWCPLVPVPPHGRLGDLDDLQRRINTLRIKAMADGVDVDPYWHCLDAILQTKTIIPAEEVPGNE